MNIPILDYDRIKFNNEHLIVLNTGKEIFLGTYQIEGNYILVLVDKELHIGIENVSFSKEEIDNDFDALYHILTHVNESHELTLFQHIKNVIKQKIDDILSFFKIDKL